MEMIVNPEGLIRCLYSEEIDLTEFGELRIRRASYVEPDHRGRWWADLAPVGGSKLGPFARRTEALEAEVEWLVKHLLPSMV